MCQIVIEVWGDIALFTRPESKVERLTYPVPTPSAARGVLAAIYSKPKEFYWQVNQIEVLKPIQYVSFRKNEVKEKMNTKEMKPIIVEDNRTQRNGTYLKDVKYRISASIVKRPDFTGSYKQLYEQAIRRIEHGKCFYQPYLGTRECIAYFELGNPKNRPINEDMDLGIMLYDVFNLHDSARNPNPEVSLFSPKMVGGVIKIPEYDSAEVLKGVSLDA